MDRTELIALLIAAVVVGDLVLLAVLLRDLPRAAEVRRLRYEQWTRRLESNPRLRALYEAHRRAWWRAMGSGLVDVVVSLAALVAAWIVLSDLGAVPLFSLRDGVSDAEFVSLLSLWLGAWLLLWLWGIKKLGTTPGLRVAGIVAVSPEDGLPVPPEKLRPPYKGDYRQDDAPRSLFVPEPELWRLDLPPPRVSRL